MSRTPPPPAPAGPVPPPLREPLDPAALACLAWAAPELAYAVLVARQEAQRDAGRR